MNCDFANDDGAYVLGALSPSERAAYERHLPTCPRCREAVAALAVLPGLLGRLDPITAANAAAPAPVPATLLPRLLEQAVATRRKERQRRRRIALAIALAALVAVIGTGFGASQIWPRETPPSATVLSPMHTATGLPIPVTGAVALEPDQAGTWVHMYCWYGDRGPGTWTVRLMVIGASGEAEQLGTWLASSDTEISLGALTHLTPGEISRVELQTADHRTLLWWIPT
jgi:anti-sigma-K factor RskA